MATASRRGLPDRAAALPHANWRPSVTVCGAVGVRSIQQAGRVLGILGINSTASSAEHEISMGVFEVEGFDAIRTTSPL